MLYPLPSVHVVAPALLDAHAKLNATLDKVRTVHVGETHRVHLVVEASGACAIVVASGALSAARGVWGTMDLPLRPLRAETAVIFARHLLARTERAARLAREAPRDLDALDVGALAEISRAEDEPSTLRAYALVRRCELRARASGDAPRAERFRVMCADAFASIPLALRWARSA